MSVAGRPGAGTDPSPPTRPPGYDLAGPQEGPYDEAFAAAGSARPHYAEVLDALGAADLEALRRRVDARVQASGCRFGGDQPFHVDPVPRILPPEEWTAVSAGVGQRLRALDAFVQDVYGEGRILAAGIIPERVVHTADHYEPAVRGHHRPVAIALAGLDLIRGPRGAFRVLEDNVRTPSGIAYAVAAREALEGELPVPAARAGIDGVWRGLLGAALRAAAPDGGGDPRVVMLSDGPGNAAFWEHEQLARRLEVALVTPADCEVSAGRLVTRDGGAGARSVDVVYRRTDEDRLQDEAGALTWVGILLDEPLRRGTLAVVNAFGVGVADDKLVHAYVEEMVRFYLREEPVLRSVETFDLGDPERRAEALERLDELVVKPRAGYGGQGIVVGPHADPDDLEVTARRIQATPEAFIAQETVHFSRHPTVVESGLAPRHVDLRPFIAYDGDQVRAFPGGLTRFALRGGDLVVNSSEGGGGKDTWVLG